MKFVFESKGRSLIAVLTVFFCLTLLICLAPLAYAQTAFQTCGTAEANAEPIYIKDSDIHLSHTKFPYLTWSAAKYDLSITVKTGGKKLECGKDYTWTIDGKEVKSSVSERSEQGRTVGPHLVAVEGVGAYAGQLFTRYIVVPAVPGLEAKRIKSSNIYGEKYWFYKIALNKSYANKALADGKYFLDVRVFVNGKKMKSFTYKATKKNDKFGRWGFRSGSKVTVKTRAYKKNVHTNTYYSGWNRITFESGSKKYQCK